MSAIAVGLAIVGAGVLVRGTGTWGKIKAFGGKARSWALGPLSAGPGHVCDADSWQCPYPLSDPRASRWMAARELGLLEAHIANAVCSECITKHLMNTTGLFDEASRLPGGNTDDLQDAATAESLRARFATLYAAKQPVTPLLPEVRALRRKTMVALNFGIPQ